MNTHCSSTGFALRHMMIGMQQQDTRIVVLRIAADAVVDPRSAAKALRGEAVKGLAGERIARAMVAAGIKPGNAT